MCHSWITATKSTNCKKRGLGKNFENIACAHVVSEVIVPRCKQKLEKEKYLPQKSDKVSQGTPFAAAPWPDLAGE